MHENQLNELISQKIKEWKISQQGQTDGYTYEKSFDSMMQSIGRDILQESVGALPSNKKLKKNSSPHSEQ